jgi:hypothetical protein
MSQGEKRLADISINAVSKLLEEAGRFHPGLHAAKVLP